MIFVPKKIRQDLSVFSCPFSTRCGLDEDIIIVPTFSGESRKYEKKSGVIDGFGVPVYFLDIDACRHTIKFPMDAKYGDYITFKIKNLFNTKITLAIGPDFVRSNNFKSY